MAQDSLSISQFSNICSGSAGCWRCRDDQSRSIWRWLSGYAPHRLRYPREIKEEGGALALDAFNLDLAAHLLDEHIGYGQPRPVPPYLRVVEVSARKRPGRASLLFLADADAYP